jgi:hypothetical protein
MKKVFWGIFIISFFIATFSYQDQKHHQKESFFTTTESATLERNFTTLYHGGFF